MSADLEHRTQAYGREIFARVDASGAAVFTPGWFDQQLMNWTMSAEGLKVQLFRFVDALPRLTDPAAITSHLKEYLGEAGDEVPWLIRHGVKWLPSRGPAARLLAWVAKANARHLARRFIVGSSVPEAIQAVKSLRDLKFAFTVDLLGEATITEAEADAVQQQYVDLLHGLTDCINQLPEIDIIDRDHLGPIPRVNVSVKLSALYSQFDPIDPEGTTRAVLSRLRPIMKLAKEQGAFVNFDMEQHSFKDTTLHIFRTVLDEPEFRDWPHVGIAMQAYLRDTEHDLHELLTWVKQRGTSVWIRLVKGAYWDYETIIAAQNDWSVPVWGQKWESDACFERCAHFLLENYELLRPAFGSHNVRSIAYTLATAEKLNVPPNAYEYQMLYGMGEEFKDSIASFDRRVRIYAPYGELLPGMAYLVRRLLENTSNESFIRVSQAGSIPEHRLLMNPTEAKQKKTTEFDSHGAANAHHGTTFRNEPLRDFSLEKPRLAMASALQQVRNQFGKQYPIVIGGKTLESGAWLDSKNPSQQEDLVGRVALATVEQANLAVQTAEQALESWRTTPVAARADLLRSAAKVMQKRHFELSAWIVFESGKSWREADADVAEAIDFCNYYALEMERLEHHHRRDVPGEDNYMIYEPRGVAVIIAPWNFPLAILCGMTAAALAAGNTTIMKPAEQTPVVAAQLMQVFTEAGFPAGVVNFLPGQGEVVGPVLVNHPDVAVIAFTGSLQVGLNINQSAAQILPEQHFVKRVIAEMGGKNAIIVDSDADLDEAVKGVVDSAFGYQGQKCSAGSRAIVLEANYDIFVQRVIEATKSLTMGPASDAGSAIGPVIDEEARQRILGMIEVGKSEAKSFFAPEIGDWDKKGFYVAPHVFVDVPPTARIAQEEIFGPVLSIIRVKDLEEALKVANGTKYALTGGLYSRSPRNIETIKQRFRVGNLYINRKITGALVDRQPFGGFKLSGIGSKAGGPDYLLQFLLPRTITENTMRRGFAPE